jgi:hypothetical protein
MFGSLDEDVGRTEYVYIIRLKLYKTRPVTQFFLVNSLYKEEFAVKEFINDLKSPKYGVINAHILDYNFELEEETTLDGMRYNLYKSKCNDEMYVRKQNIFFDGTYYLGGSR